MLYAPFDSFLHLSAAACGEPLGSLKMNQLRVVPEPESSLDPQPTATAAAKARTNAITPCRRPAVKRSPLPSPPPSGRPGNAPPRSGLQTQSARSAPRLVRSDPAGTHRSPARPRRARAGAPVASPALTATRCSPRAYATTPWLGVEQPQLARELAPQRDQLAVEARASTRRRAAGRRRCARAGSVGASHGSPVVKPPVGEASHCIGWRWASRPKRSTGGSARPAVDLPDLVALVDEGGPRAASAAARRPPRAACSPEPRGEPREVVVGEHPGQRRRSRVRLGDRTRAAPRPPSGECRSSKRERHVEVLEVRAPGPRVGR